MRLMRHVFGVAVVSVALFVIVVRNHDEAARQWAVSIIAFVLGWYFRLEGRPRRVR